MWECIIVECMLFLLLFLIQDCDKSLLWEIWNHIEANTYILLGKTLIFSGLVTIPPLAPNSFFQGFLFLFDPPQRQTIYVRLGFGIWNIFLRFLELRNQTR